MLNPEKPNTVNTYSHQTTPEAEAVAAIVKRYVKPTPIDPNNSKVLVLPEGLRVESLKKFIDECRTSPERRKGTANFDDLDSFIEHVKRFADEGSALFASQLPEPTLTSVLDYHWEGPESEADPRFGEHRGVYSFPVSNEWDAWIESNNKPFDQRAFAAFLEDRLTDVVGDPSNAGERSKQFAESINATFAPAWKLLELSRGMSIREGSIDGRVSRSSRSSPRTIGTFALGCPEGSRT